MSDDGHVTARFVTMDGSEQTMTFGKDEGVAPYTYLPLREFDDGPVVGRRRFRCISVSAEHAEYREDPRTAPDAVLEHCIVCDEDCARCGRHYPERR